MPALRSLRRKAKARVSATPASARLSTATPFSTGAPRCGEPRHTTCRTVSSRPDAHWRSCGGAIHRVPRRSRGRGGSDQLVGFGDGLGPAADLAATRPPRVCAGQIVDDDGGLGGAGDAAVRHAAGALAPGHVDDVVQDPVLHPARRTRMIRGPGVPGVRPRAGRPWRPARRRVHHRHRRRVVRGWEGRRDLSGGHPFTARPAAQVPHRPRATRARSGAPVIPVGLGGTGQMPLLRVVHPCARPSTRRCASEAATIRPQMAPTGDNRHGGR
jgi:hypothetical protein